MHRLYDTRHEEPAAANHEARRIRLSLLLHVKPIEPATTAVSLFNYTSNPSMLSLRSCCLSFMAEAAGSGALLMPPAFRAAVRNAGPYNSPHFSAQRKQSLRDERWFQ